MRSEIQDPNLNLARGAIRGRLHRTPILSSETLGRAFDGRAFLKAELLQKTGSFKPRGVLTKLASLSEEEKGRGVISISAGNHAQALAYGCALEGIDCLVVMWRGASEQKIAATREYGAAVDLEAGDPGEAFERLAGVREETGRTLVHPYDDPLVIAGQGTVGVEIGEDLADVDAVIVPVGGGGLISGIASALPGKRVVGVEPEGSAALHAALEAGRPVRIEPDSIADALSAPVAGEHAVEICTRLRVESVLVNEDDIAAGFRFLYERAKLAAEPGAAVGVGAALSGKIDGLEGRTACFVISGGNVSPKIASAILEGDEA
jgi:threonine dehydratase